MVAVAIRRGQYATPNVTSRLSCQSRRPRDVAPGAAPISSSFPVVHRRTVAVVPGTRLRLVCLLHPQICFFLFPPGFMVEVSPRTWRCHGGGGGRGRHRALLQVAFQLDGPRRLQHPEAWRPQRHSHLSILFVRTSTTDRKDSDVGQHNPRSCGAICWHLGSAFDALAV